MTDAKEPLYVKYRPRKYEQFIQGVQGAPICRLVAQETANLHPPCIVLHADYGMGKTSLARVRLARRNCHRWTDHPYEPCGECPGCRGAFRGGGGFETAGFEIGANTADWFDQLEHYLTATRGTKYWSGNPALRPVVVIDEFWRATLIQQVSLLQELERGQYAFILITSQDGKIDGGILSRSLYLTFATPSEENCRSWVRRIIQAERVTCDPGVVELLVQVHHGRPREILTALQELTLAQRHVSMPALRAYLDMSGTELAGAFGGLA
jgi:DNA polymerase III gamma/tau subunit